MISNKPKSKWLQLNRSKKRNEKDSLLGYLVSKPYGSEVSVEVKMKRCSNCKTLASNSAKVCTKCGSKELEKGTYTDESNEDVIYNRDLPKNEIRRCPICGGEGVITTRHGMEHCSVCSIM